jgi:SOS-response transcriptional repressor LexA
MPGRSPNLNSDIRKQQIVEAINTYTADHGHSPSTREIADMLGMTAWSRVADLVQKMLDEGLLVGHVDSRGHLLPRTLRVSEATMVHLKETM